MSFNFNNPPYEKISVQIIEGDIIIKKGKGWANRNDSMEKLLLEIKSKIDVSKNKKFIINTGDNPVNNGNFPYPVLSFSTKKGYFDIPIPGFQYDHWIEAKIPHWEEIVNQILEKGKKIPTNNKAIWIGAPVNQIRIDAYNYFSNYQDLIDYWLMNWDSVRSNSSNARYMSLFELLDYKILYDLPGVGHSGRIYYFFYAQRPVIKLWDNHIMWFNQYLIDNSITYAENYNDMISYTKILLSNNDLYNEVVKNTLEIGKKYLSKTNALNYLTEVINNI